MINPENITIFEKTFVDAWLRWSLNADNPAQYLDHPDAQEPHEYRYFPSHVTRGGLRWNLGNVALLGTDQQFTIPAHQITGVFVNIKASHFMIAIKEPQSYWAESEQDDKSDPFDRYPLKDYDFRIPYTTQVRNTPVVVIDKSVISAIGFEH